MNFGRIASLYDGLARIIFGKTLQTAQIEAINTLPATGKVLVVGGGTGWIIPPILEIGTVEQLYYLEEDSQMMVRSINGCEPRYNDRVVFIEGDETAIPNLQFDAVVTNFVLDCFTQQRLQSVVTRLQSRVKPGGKWYFCDFQIADRGAGRLWQIPLTWAMIRFFKVAVGLEANRLLDLEGYLNRRGFSQAYRRTYFGNFVVSIVYLVGETTTSGPDLR